MSKVLLEAKGVCKAFGPTIALNEVSLTLKSGEVVGFVGENGSGKSTLSSIIAGIQPMDSGELLRNGEPYAPKSAIEAQSRGVSMVVQEMGAIPTISVAENIFLGKEKSFSKLGLVNSRAMNLAAKKALERVGAKHLRPDAPIASLAFEDRKIVELAKAMTGEPEVLIVDETTTALSLDGRELLYGVVDELKNSGRGVIFITHDLDELMRVCTKITVIRDGLLIGSLEREEFDENVIKAMMVGREMVGNMYRSDLDGSCSGEVALRAKNVSGAQLVENVSFELHRGEILGVGGLTDSGMHELGRIAFGLSRAIIGEVTLFDGERVSGASRAVSRKIGYVSKNRDQEALMLNASVLNNISIASVGKLLKNGLVSKKRERELAVRQVESLSIKTSGLNQQVRFLSGGNKQKVVFGKWIANDSDILILDCPTRGVDIGVKSAMYRLIEQMKRDGRAVLLISEELTELIGMSDRILIMKSGRVSGEFSREQNVTEQDLIHAMI